MTVMLELAPEEEAMLVSRARLQGVAPEDYVRRAVFSELERERQREKNQAAITLLQGWLEEELPDSESEAAVKSWEASMKALDEDRLSSRKLFP